MKNLLLGQHFLVNKTAVNIIISELNLEKNDLVIEIGPGMGALTLPLARACEKIGCEITGIEKDSRLVDELRSATAKGLNNLKIIHGDALKLLNSPLFETINPKLNNWKLVGNIPYYITGKLLRVTSELKYLPKLVVLTIQKEVAERLSAKPPKMNLLSAATQFWSSPEIIYSLKPKDFSPAPKIDSSIIKLISRVHPLASNYKDYQSLTENYYSLIKILFKQPRKTVFNNLRSGLKSDEKTIIKALNLHNLTGKERPQDLSLEVLIKLAIYRASYML